MQAPPNIEYKALYEEEKALHQKTKYLYGDALARLDQAGETIAKLQHRISLLEKMVFGSKQERFVPAPPASDSPVQSEAEDVPAGQGAAGAGEKTVQVTYTRTIKTAKEPAEHPGRNPLSPHLRRIDTVIEPDHIPEGSIRIGEDITEKLEYIPGEFVVKRTIRPKYLVPSQSDEDHTRIIAAPLPVEGIYKCIAGPGLLSQILIDKFLFHLPAYRQLQRFEHSGITIAYSTLIAWIGLAANLLEALYDALRKELTQSGYIHADETTIGVLDQDKKGKKIHKGYFWAYHNSIKKLVYFDYQPGRNKQASKGILSKFKGYLQTDGLEIYDDYDKSEHIIHLNCMAHARRYFVDAQETDRPQAEYALKEIQKLYAIERKCRELPFDQRKEMRQEQSVPILKSLEEWMKQQKALPGSPVKKAIAYCTNRWEKLCRYTENGMLCIDNNPAENVLRALVLGRKNYMFTGSHEAAGRTAMVYSLVGCCKLNGMNPYEWLKDVLTRLPMHPINRIKELLPHNWKTRQTTILNSS